MSARLHPVYVEGERRWVFRFRQRELQVSGLTGEEKNKLRCPTCGKQLANAANLARHQSLVKRCRPLYASLLGMRIARGE